MKTLIRKCAKWSLILGCAGLVLLGGLSASQYLRLGGSHFAAGAREQIERARHIQEHARPTYESEALATLAPNPLNGPYFRLDDRFAAATVLEEPAQADPSVDEIIHGFEFGEESKLAPIEGRSTVRVTDGVLVVAHDDDYLASAPGLVIPSEHIGTIEVRMATDRGKYMSLAWSPEEKPGKFWKNEIDTPLESDGEFHTYRINAAHALRGGLDFGQPIRSIFFKPSDVDGAEARIDYIRFVSKRAGYSQAPRGLTYETLGREMRRALYMLPDQHLQYRIQVPEDAPSLELGYGVLLSDLPIEFQVELVANGKTNRFLSPKKVRQVRWHDLRIDLSPWAGQEVRISLRVQGAAQNVAFWSSPIVASRPVKPFNVVFVLEDTLRADHLSARGHPQPTSPFKEELMRDGVQFMNTVSQATKTRPSVSSMMTSLLPTATGVWHFSDALRDEYLTLAEVMRSQGFATASFIQNGNAGPYAGGHQGFSTLLDVETLGDAVQDVLGERTLGWIQRNRHRNFFLYLHVLSPHGPYDPPDPFDACYADVPSGAPEEERDLSLDAEWVDKPTRAGRTCLYDGEIRHNDAVLREFVDRLEQMGLRENTLLVLTSDHGEFLGEYGEWEHHPPGYPQVIHVPLMMSYPGRFSEGRELVEPVSLMDIAPTVMELAGVDTDELLLQGDSLVDLVEDGGQRDWHNRIVVSEVPTDMSKTDLSRNQGIEVQGSLFFRGWQLMSSRYFSPWRVSPVLKLKVFEFTGDGAETESLVLTAPDPWVRYRVSSLLNELQAQNTEARRRFTAGGAGNVHDFDPETLERLKALGYVE